MPSDIHYRLTASLSYPSIRVREERVRDKNTITAQIHQKKLAVGLSPLRNGGKQSPVHDLFLASASI